jgi:hypothetical protein
MKHEQIAEATRKAMKILNKTILTDMNPDDNTKADLNCNQLGALPVSFTHQAPERFIRVWLMNLFADSMPPLPIG